MLEVLRPIPARQLSLLVFDLDGTLIDSRKDLATAVNVMLGVLDRPPLPEDVIAGYIGDGAGMLVRRALGDPSDERLVARGLGLFLESYREHKLDHTYVYEGVFAALETLGTRADGAPYTMAVLTNKPISPSLEICTALGLAPYFSVISGGNSFATKKPDPEGLRAIMRGANAKPEETLMIGDSEVDILTARAAGTWSLGCRYGLSPHSIEAMREQGLVDAVVDAPAEWPRALGRDSYAGAHSATTGLTHGF
jgi:phosphoglycolate phosphatase